MAVEMAEPPLIARLIAWVSIAFGGLFVTEHASICFRGHVQSITSRPGIDQATTEACPQCGAAVLSSCPGCQALIPEHTSLSTLHEGGRGYKVRLNTDYLVESYERPSFCVACGGAYPWLGRQERIWELENRLGRLVNDDHQRLVLSEQLQALMSDDLDDDEAIGRWQRVAKIAGAGFNNVMTEVGLPLINAAAKSKLGLDN